jgi:hypothetical protein
VGNGSLLSVMGIVMPRGLFIVCLMGAGWMTVTGSVLLMAATAFGWGR